MARLGVTLTASTQASTETGLSAFISVGLVRADCTELLPTALTKRVLTVWPSQDRAATFRLAPPRVMKLPTLLTSLVRLVQTAVLERKSCDCRFTIRSPSE